MAFSGHALLHCMRPLLTQIGLSAFDPKSLAPYGLFPTCYAPPTNGSVLAFKGGKMRRRDFTIVIIGARVPTFGAAKRTQA